METVMQLWLLQRSDPHRNYDQAHALVVRAPTRGKAIAIAREHCNAECEQHADSYVWRVDLLTPEGEPGVLLADELRG